MGGDILLDSVAGFGSLFTLVLPFKPTQQLPESSTELEMTSFLLASDSRAMHEVQSLYDRAGCVSEGLLVSEGMDAAEVCARIKQNLNYIDLIVLDLRHSLFTPGDVFDAEIRQRCRIIVMHYDLLLCDSEAVAGYEFISVINTSKNLRRLLQHEIIETSAVLQADSEAGQADFSENQAKSVLIVDDNPINLMLASELTHLWGHQPFEAQNAEQAMELFRVKRFDLILLDIQMPEIDGVKLMKMMRAERPELKTPIAAITANILESEKQRLLELGFDVYFRKPIEEHKLEALLNRGEIIEDQEDEIPVSENAALAIDVDLTYKLSANSPKLVQEMLHMLDKELPGYQRQLQLAIDGKSAAAVGKVIHKLMGVTCYAGLPRLKEVLDRYETTKSEGGDALLSFAERVANELETVRKALTELKDSEFFSGSTGSASK
jgi:CheY-like chemotaxis protein